MEPSIFTNVRNRVERSARVLTLKNRFESLRTDALIVPQDVHDWCVNLLRNPEKRFSYREELSFDNIYSCIDYIKNNNNFGDECICFGYKLDIDASFFAKTKYALDLILDVNTILSMDGIILANQHITSGFILDYEDADESGALGNVSCSVLGELALGAQSPENRLKGRSN